MKIRQMIYSLVYALVNKSVHYAQTSPRFRSFALKSVAFVPGLNLRLHRIYSESPKKRYASSTTWDLETEFNLLTTVDPDGSVAQRALPLNGINAHQRTPLEMHFTSYRRDL